jgi:hypothetical protein
MTLKQIKARIEKPYNGYCREMDKANTAFLNMRGFEYTSLLHYKVFEEYISKYVNCIMEAKSW